MSLLRTPQAPRPQKIKECDAFRVAPTASRGFGAPKQRVLRRGTYDIPLNLP